MIAAGPYQGLNYWGGQRPWYKLLGGQNPYFNFQKENFNLKVPGSQNYWGAVASLAPPVDTAL